MTIDNVIFLAVGLLANGLTFACGVAVGISLTRKDVRDDSDNDEEEQDDGWGEQPSGR